jgi:protein-S-isoprenylcysteine O-methyltransferase Ste14
MKPTELIYHIRDVIILPGSVLVLIPYNIHQFTPYRIPGFWSIKLLSIVLFLLGLMLFIWANYLFHSIGKGTLAPWSVKEKLIKQGPYKYNRNPMITGVLMMLIGEFLWFRSIPIMLWFAIFFLITSTVFILVEEPFLQKKFGEDYIQYKKEVPRWIPKF